MIEIYTQDTETLGLMHRSKAREVTLMKSTMALISSYIQDGDSEEEAKTKVRAISVEISNLAPGAKYDFKLGDVDPLKNIVLQIATNGTFPYFTEIKANIVLNILNQAV